MITSTRRSALWGCGQKCCLLHIAPARFTLSTAGECPIHIREFGITLKLVIHSTGKHIANTLLQGDVRDKLKSVGGKYTLNCREDRGK